MTETKQENRIANRQLVSIITPAYNAERFLEATIASAQAQTYANWEMLIMDDCSTDLTKEIAAKASDNDARIHVFTQENNGGPARAWNRAFREVRGRYVAFLDADDLWVPDKLERQIAFMEEKRAAFSFAEYDWIDAEGKSLGKTIHVPEKQNYKQMLKNSVIGTLTVMLDREKLTIWEIPPVQINDSMLWLSLAKEGVTAYGMREVMGHYRIVSDSFSRNKKSAAKGLWDLYKNELGIPFFPRCWYFANYAWNSVKRYYLSK